MPLSTKFSERLTTVLSTIVAAAMLAAGVTAQQGRMSRPPSLEQLESDLRFQIGSAFRMTPLQAKQRLVQVDTVMNDYRSQTRNKADQSILEKWLEEATIRSIPGSIKPLPAAPVYLAEPPPQQVEVTKPPRTVRPRPAVTASKKPTPAFGGESLLAIAPPLEIDRPRVEISILSQAKTTEPPPLPSPVQVQVAQAQDLPEKAGTKPSAYSKQEDLPSPQPMQLVSEADVEVEPIKPPVELVHVNLRELDARIAGYHAAMDTLEAALIESPEPTENLLAEQIETLESLAPDYQFVKLYYESLDAEERRRVTTPRQMRELLVTTREQIRTLQAELEADFLEEYDRSFASRLQKLSVRLDEVAAKVGW